MAQKLEHSRASMPLSNHMQQQGRTLKNSITGHHPSSAPQQLGQQPQSSLRDFHVHKKIGVGAYSEVYQVTRKSDGIEYALKQVKIQKLTEKEKQNALNEVRILASINNVNVIAYKEAFFDEASSTLCIVMEFADSGDLYSKIMAHQQAASEFGERQIWDALVQMAAGLKALHARNILHRDLKSANVFLHSDGSLKLGDLNVSKQAKNGMLYTQTGTPYYASPEVWQERPYDSKSDIWSLGCIVYEMCALAPPFRAKSMKGLFNSVLSGMYPKLPLQYSDELGSIVKLLLQVSPVKRPNCEQLLQHELVQRYLRSAQNSGYGSAAALVSDQDKSNIHDQLLQTIHCPRNLSQLSQILPRSNYQTGSERNGGQELELITPAQPAAPYTAVNAGEGGNRKKRRQKTSEGDRNQIIELAQQIVLPPIREIDASGSAVNLNAPAPGLYQQQQQQSQAGLAGLRRKKNSSNRGKVATAPDTGSGGVGSTNSDRRRSSKAQQLVSAKQPQTQHEAIEEQHLQPQYVSAEAIEGLQLEKKRKLKAQFQIRQQTGRPATKASANASDARHVSNRQAASLVPHSQQTSALASYPRDVANTLAAQNLQFLDNYSSSLVDLPPSIENIYASQASDLISLSSRFNHAPVNMNLATAQNEKSLKKQSPGTAAEDSEQATLMNRLQNIATEVGQRQQQQHQKTQLPYVSHNVSSSYHRISGQPPLESLQQQQQHRSLIMGAQEDSNTNNIYASQSTLPMTSLAGANRYQSVAVMRDLPIEVVSTAGAVPPTQVKSGGGVSTVMLPGLKQSLQSIRSAQQLQKAGSQSYGQPMQQPVGGSGSIKMINKAKQEGAGEQSQQQLTDSGEYQHREGTAVSHQQKTGTTSQATLPPRQPSTTRNGGAQRHQTQKQLKTGSLATVMSQRNLAANQYMPAPRQHNTKDQPAKERDPHEETKKSASPSSKQTPPVGSRHSYAEAKVSSPKVSVMQRRQTMQQSTSQKSFKPMEGEVRIDESSGLSKAKQGIISKINSRAMQASVDASRRSKQADLTSSLPQSKLAAKKKKDLTQSISQTNQDKSKIMVELMPIQGNSGRVSIKGTNGRNQGDNFATKVDHLTSNEESLRMLLAKNNNDENKPPSGTKPDLEASSGLEAAQNMAAVGSDQPKNASKQSNDGSPSEQVIANPRPREKQATLKSMRLQQRIQGGKAPTVYKNPALGSTRLQPRGNDPYGSSPAVYKDSEAQNFTKAQFIAVFGSGQNASQEKQIKVISMPHSQILKAETSSNQLVKQPSEAQLGGSRHVPVSQAMMTKSKSTATSNPKLPQLKPHPECEENVQTNGSCGKVYKTVAKQTGRVETQQSERSNVPLSKEAVSSMSNLEKGKQQLEKIRSLASVRQSKNSKQSAASVWGAPSPWQMQKNSVQANKNGSNSKAAAALLTSSIVPAEEHQTQYQQTSSSPGSAKMSGPSLSKNAQTAGSVSQLNARSQLPKLPACQEGRGATKQSK